MADEKKQPAITIVISIVTFVIGTILGPGFVWNMKKSEIEKERLELEKILKTTELRQQIGEIQNQIIEVSGEYIIVRDEYNRSQSYELQNKILKLKPKLDRLKDDFLVAEKKLAEIEKRAVREIRIDIVPPSAPQGFMVIQ